ncbi:MAG: glycoside hydrolase family 30 protein [Anaerolineae bacterium]|nr:MAG: glycoside hydrolase family 30 protein [Anaerolineae bacterium]
MSKADRIIQVFRTAKETGDRLAQSQPIAFEERLEPAAPSILVDAGTRYQEIEGFGGAFTEAAAVTFYRLSPERRSEILRAYFDPDAGHGYTLCRTHINSCDFSLGNYAYSEVDGDVALEHFIIERDRQALIPMIKEAQKGARKPLKLLASPWSPPAWMKTNGHMNYGGKLKPEYREVWARYYCRYIREYGAEGIPIWGVSVQNEPEATQTWDSCLYTAEEERDFVRDYLGPALEREGLAEVRVIIWDHNRDRMFERAKVVYDDPQAAQYVWGTGFHWYVADRFENVQLVHDAYPDKKLLFTEGCQEGGPHLGSWDPGERYARSIVNDLNRWTVGWIDWNMVLDESGGPNHVGNYCSAPIIADTRAGTLHYQSSYYYIGHFSRFIRPGAVRVLCATTRDQLEATAFLNPDGQLAVVVLNRSEENVPFALKFDGAAALTQSQARSIMTCCFPSDR